MKPEEAIFQEFVDAIQTADSEAEFGRVAKRAAEALGFRWFAYLSFRDIGPKLISTYPRAWTDRYFTNGYEKIDPVVIRARSERALFQWDGQVTEVAGALAQRRFFDEAITFGIKTGVTVPVRSGFGSFSAFTLASEEAIPSFHEHISRAYDLLPLMALYYHTHVAAKLMDPARDIVESALTQRERQCLAWAARGKTKAETATIIGVTARTVVFHIENARRKLGAASVSHAVSLALRRGWLT
jgi:LuxR family transcriptional regulator, activator of conjugal transfer of Ti plasmids